MAERLVTEVFLINRAPQISLKEKSRWLTRAKIRIRVKVAASPAAVDNKVVRAGKAGRVGRVGRVGSNQANEAGSRAAAVEEVDKVVAAATANGCCIAVANHSRGNRR